jgi:hypothetical protein
LVEPLNLFLFDMLKGTHQLLSTDGLHLSGRSR